MNRPGDLGQVAAVGDEGVRSSHRLPSGFADLGLLPPGAASRFTEDPAYAAPTSEVPLARVQQQLSSTLWSDFGKWRRRARP